MAYFRCNHNGTRALFTITANPNCTITASSSVVTYTGTTSSEGVLLILVYRKGTYTITSSYSDMVSATINVTGNYAYTANLYLDPVFGSGSDGSQTLASSATWYAGSEDTGVIERNYKNLTINSGVSISAGNRNSGIIIRCQGNCTINGAIYNIYAPRSHSSDLSAYYPSWMISNGAGGSGSAGGTGSYYGGSAGAGQSGRYYGGGYGGGASGGGGTRYRDGQHDCYGGAGGSATGITINTSIFMGGASVDGGPSDWYKTGNAGSYGGGGSGGAYTQTGYSGDDHWSGAGGTNAGASGGNAWGTGWSGVAGGGGGAGNYGGGTAILYVAGTLTVNGGIYCYGSNGGSGGSAISPSGEGVGNGGTGGGGGGGRIYLMSGSSISLGGTFNVSGGNGAGSGTRHYIYYSNYNQGAGTPTAF